MKRQSIPTNTYTHTQGLVLLFAAIVMLTACAVASAGKAGDFAEHKRKALEPVRAEFTKVVNAHRNDPALQTFTDRLELMDNVASLLIRRFEVTKSTSLDTLLGDVGGLTAGSAAKQTPPNTMSALDVIVEFTDQFAVALPKPLVSEQDLQILYKYYDVAARAAGDYIAQQGRTIITIEKNAVDVLELCLVMPFLHIPDQNWSAREIEILPEWMRTPQYLKTLEDFSLRLRRPYTAYQLLLYYDKQQKGPPIKTLTYPEYLKTSATRMLEDREYHAAIHCLKSAIEAREKDNSQEGIVDLHLQLAEIFIKAGHTQLAANQVKHVLDQYPKSSHWGKAALLRLKYLYESARFDEIFKESPEYQADKRCGPYLPQILYISWVSHRRKQGMEQADKLQKVFIDKFPKHPLAADMYFASAMTALAKSDYEETQRLLEIIEYQYPQSRIMGKVKQIKGRLEKTLDSTGKSKGSP